MRNYGFSDATEIFVFISGYTAVIAYSRMMHARRLARAPRRASIAASGSSMSRTSCCSWPSPPRSPGCRSPATRPALIEEMQLLGLGENPYQAILEAALLKFRPVNLDVLPLYIVLLAAFPFVLPAVLRWPLAVIAASLALLCGDHATSTGTCRPIPTTRSGSSIPWPGRSCFYVGAACAVLAPAARLARPLAPAAGHPGGALLCCLPPLSPCPGTIIRWNA